LRHSGECRNPETATVNWMPACAGMTDIIYFLAAFICLYFFGWGIGAA
jgi:hypothetical protein